MVRKSPWTETETFRSVQTFFRVRTSKRQSQEESDAVVLQSHGSLPENHRLPSTPSPLGTSEPCRILWNSGAQLSDGNPKGHESRSKIQVLGPLGYLGGLGEMPLSHTVTWLLYLEKMD